MASTTEMQRVRPFWVSGETVLYCNSCHADSGADAEAIGRTYGHVPGSWDVRQIVLLRYLYAVRSRCECHGCESQADAPPSKMGELRP